MRMEFEPHCTEGDRDTIAIVTPSALRKDATRLQGLHIDVGYTGFAFITYSNKSMA